MYKNNLQFNSSDLKNSKIFINYRIREYLREFIVIQIFATDIEKRKLVELILLKNYLSNDTNEVYHINCVNEMLRIYQTYLLTKYKDFDKSAFKK